MKTNEFSTKQSYLELMNLIASKAFVTIMMGKIGPKISSCITGSLSMTSIKIVGSIYFSEESVLPPIATFPDFSKLLTRLKNK